MNTFANRRPGWIGFDLDGTIAHHDQWVSASHVGAPIAPVVNVLKNYLSSNLEVRIFTARVYPLVVVHKPGDMSLYELGRDLLAETFDTTPDAAQFALDALTAIRGWCREHIGQELPVTCIKDFAMLLLYDDRAVHVERNTGRILTPLEQP